MSSLYPEYKDVFTRKVDETGDGKGDYVMAEHVNDLQDSIVAIEGTLGIDPQGDALTVKDRIQSIEDRVKVFRLPAACIYNGDPALVNSSVSVAEAADLYTYFKYVILAKGIESELSELNGKVRELIGKAPKVNFCGTVDMTESLTLVKSKVYAWISMGAKGVYLENFGYEHGVDRTKQNAVLDYLHERGAFAIFSSADPDNILSSAYSSGMNPNYIDPSITSNDVYIHFGFDSDNTLSVANKLINYRAQYGFKICGLSNSGSYDYAHAFAILLSYDIFYAQPDTYGSDNVLTLHDVVPVLGDFYVSTPNITNTSGTLSRHTPFGEIVVNTVANTFRFTNVKVPGYMVDASTTWEALTPGVITAINSPEAVGTIDPSKLGTFTTGDFEKIAAAVIEAINVHADLIDADKIEAKVVEAMAITSKTIGADVVNAGLARVLDLIATNAEFQRISTNLINAVNANIDNAKIDGARIGNLDASIITSGHLDASIITPGSIGAEHLEIGLLKGIDHWLYTYIEDGHVDPFKPQLSNIAGIQYDFQYEIQDTTDMNFLTYLGVSHNHVGMLETNLVVRGSIPAQDAQFTITASGQCVVYIDGVEVLYAETPGVGRLVPVPQLDTGIHKIQIVYEDTHSAPHIVLSKMLSAKKADDPGRYVFDSLQRMDCYAEKTTIIEGNMIRTGSITADEIATGTITAGNIAAGTLTSESGVFGAISADIITSGEINVDVLKATVIEAVNAEYVTLDAEHIVADEALIDSLAANLINAMNIRATNMIVGDAQIDQAVIGNLNASKITAGDISAARLTANAISAINADISTAKISAAHIGQLDVDNMKAAVVAAINAYIQTLTAEQITAGVIDADAIRGTVIEALTASLDNLIANHATLGDAVIKALSADIIEALNIHAQTITAGDAVLSSAVIGSLTAEQIQAHVIEAIQIAVDQITGDTATFKQMIADVLSAQVINAANVRITSSAGGTGEQLVIDEGGMDIASQPKVNPTDVYWPADTKIIRINKNGIGISSDGGHVWTTKLTGSSLNVISADIGTAQINDAHIADVSADKLTAGTIDAGEITVINLNANNVTSGTLSGIGMTIGTGNNIFKATADGISLGNATFADAPFSVDMTGHLKATNANITGSITSTTGNIGGILIDSQGLVLNTGSIVDTRDAATQKLYISKTGIIAGDINATSGTINGIHITPEGIQAFTAPAAADIITNITNITNNTQVENNEFITNNYYLQPDSIRVRGNESVIIDTGTLVVKDDASVNRIILGKLADTYYGLYFDFLNGKYLRLSKDGFVINDGTKNTINATSTGNVTITGTINADAGYLKTMDITGVLTIGTSGKIVTGTTELSSTGLTMTNGVIKLGTGTAGPTGDKTHKFYVDSTSGILYAEGVQLSGNVYATGGTIGGWVIGANTLSSGNITLDSTTSSIKAGSTNYAQLDTNGLTIVGGAVNITTAASGAKKLEIKSTGIVASKDADNRVEFDGDGIRVIKNGTTLGSALTPDGLVGTLLTDQSVLGTKFDKTPPEVPASVSATSALEQIATGQFVNIDVTWAAVADAAQDLQGYKVYLKEGAGNYIPQAVAQKTSTSYTIRNVKPNTGYTVAVSSYDVTGNESALSTGFAIVTTKDTVAPSAVTLSSLTVVNGIKMFSLSWTPVTTNTDATQCLDIDHYEVQRHDGVNWTTVNRTYSTNIVDKEIAYDTYYSYRIRAVDTSGNTSAWTQKDAGVADRVGSADIVAGSITAEVLNVGSMVKNIDPNRTILFHFDGVTTSTQDMRPIQLSSGAWVDGKFGNAIAIEEQTENLISTLTTGNSGFGNGTIGWTVGGAEYQTTGGIGGAEDGYVVVNQTNKVSITATGLTANSSYTLSFYVKNFIYDEPTSVIVKKDTVEVIRNTLGSEWKRIKYTFTTGVGQTSTTIEFTSLDDRKVGIDNVQLEHRDFMTAFTESYNLDGHIRPHSWVMYASERLSPKQGIVSFWYKPDRNGLSPTQSGRVLFFWGNIVGDYISFSIDNTNKPVFAINSGSTTKSITHLNAIDPNDWNCITARWNCDPTTDSAKRYMDVFLNGDPTVESNRVDLSTFTAPNIAESYFTIGNMNNDTHYSANGSFDEYRIDVLSDMNEQEYQEIISWYKSTSTFFDASSQIDADSQGISAAAAKVRINNEGITVRDGVIKVVSDDGITLIGGGRLNVNGINVGVAQSESEIYNGNFSAPDTTYGLGDMYLGVTGIVSIGAKFWRSRRSSGPSYTNAVQQVYSTYLVDAVLDWNALADKLGDAYGLALAQQEAATHTIRNNVLQMSYAAGACTVVTAPVTSAVVIPVQNALIFYPSQTVVVGNASAGTTTTIASIDPVNSTITVTELSTLAPGDYVIDQALLNDTVTDEFAYEANKMTDDKVAEWRNFGMAALRYNDANGDQVIKIIRYQDDSSTLQYIKYYMNYWTYEFSIPDSEIDPVTQLPFVYEATEEEGVFGHTVYQVLPEKSEFGKTGYARLGSNPVNEKPKTSVIGVGDGTTSTFTIPGAPIANVLSLLVNTTPQFQNINYTLDSVIGLVTFLPGSIPAAGAAVTAIYNDFDPAEVSTSLEQNLANLTTYTDGLKPEGTNWKQYIFTFYAKWESKPMGSQGKLLCEVDELVPKYTVNGNNEAVLVPSMSIVVPDVTVNTNDFLIYNTDFTHQKYRAVIGNADYDRTNYTRKINSVRYASILPTLKVRYIRDWASSNTTDTNLYWTDFGVFDALAQVVVPTGITSDTTVTDIANAMDGNPLTAAVIPQASAGLHYLQLDLGSAKTLGAISIWHYPDGRTFHGTMTEVSEDGVKWYTIYNSLYQGEYVEGAQGKTIGGLMPDNITPAPIIVEEVLTEKGATAAGKAVFEICDDGLTIPGVTTSKYLSTAATGDWIAFEFQSDSMIDIDLNVIKDPLSGWSGIFTDNIFYGEADSSYPVPRIESIQQNGYPAGKHRIEVVVAGQAGNSTASGVTHARFALVSGLFYDFAEAVQTTTVEYEEVDSNAWNKITIKPNKVNTKNNGVPVITAENVPIRYRARVKYIKPTGDIIPSVAMVTAVQAELGENESFTRLNYGPGSMPTSVLQPYNIEIDGSGITARMYENYIPQRSTKESGVQERHIADAQITPAKLAQGAVVADKIAEGNVGFTKLAKIPKHQLAMNVSLSDYHYPIILPANMNPAIRYIPAEIELDSENIYVNGQVQFVGEDYTLETVTAAQRVDNAAINEKATKITFLRTILPTDKVWGDYFVVV